MEAKSLGVIGGMGPKATSVFFDKIIENTDAEKDQDHINMIILNHATLPDRTSVILNEEESLFLDAIQKDIKLLEAAEASNIAIPCNTSHYFYKQMQQMTHVNIINMVEETAKFISEKYGENSRVGIMATNGTINTGIYEKACNKYNMELHVPEPTLQEQIMRIIYEDIKSGLEVDVDEVESIIKYLINEQNCTCVILACTEFSCVTLSEDVSNYCVDAMDVLVKKSIELSEK